MKLPLIGGILVVISVAIIGGYVLLNQRGQTDTPASSPVATPEADDGALTNQDNLFGLAANQQCTFNDTNSSSEGVVFMAENRMRSDFTTTVEGNTTQGHAILKDGFIFLWVEGEETGFKSEVSEDSGISEQLRNINSNIDLNQVDYNCEAWSPDEATFEVPTDVEFEDFSAVLENLESFVGQEGDQCGICDSLPQEAAEECRQALSC